MKLHIRIALSLLATLMTFNIKAQQESEKLFQWKGRIDFSGEYSSYRPAFQTIPSSYGYVNSDQQLIVDGIPFRGNLFLSSYQSSSLNRYSLSFDAAALQQTVDKRIQQRISELQQIPSVEAMHQSLDDLEEPGQYGRLDELNERIKDNKIPDGVSNEEFDKILQQQKQLERYNPEEYAKYEQYLQLKSIDHAVDYRREARMLKNQGLLSSGEALWYNFDALQIGNTSPYFSDLDLAGVPVRGYFAAYSNPLIYAAIANGNTLPFNVADSLMSFSRYLRAYKIGYGGIAKSHLHASYVHGADASFSNLTPGVANTVGGLDGRLNLLKGKIDLQARTYLSVYTSNSQAQSETNTIDAEEITNVKGLGEWLSSDVNLNSSSVAGDAHHYVLKIQDKDLQIAGEYRRVDPRYKSVGLAYLQSDVERIQFSVDKYVFKRKIRVYGKVRLDQDNLNGAKVYTSNNVNGMLRIYSYFRKLPNISLTYMPNFHSSVSYSGGEKLTHESHMLSLAGSKSYRFLKLNQVSSGSLTYNTYHLQSGTFSSLNSSFNQVLAINRRIKTSVQLLHRQTNASYYWSFMSTFRYLFSKRSAAHISFRYGQDYFQNTRYALNFGTRIKINEKLLFGLSIIQNYYTQTTRIEDLRVRSSISAIW
ncbi:MAG: hypothetical protein JKX73_01865 [Flavobacteriales bacterium]|nr:hypothetical protein [Flavobacteriales bacterium]